MKIRRRTHMNASLLAATDQRPLSRHAGVNPFGPFVDPRDIELQKKAVKERQALDTQVLWLNEGPFDIRGQADYTTLAAKDVSLYSWGSIIIDALCSNTVTGSRPEIMCHAEIRLVGYTSGMPFLMMEQACGNHNDLAEALSSGPIRYEIDVGDMPDRIEIQARARRGGSAETTVSADEVLTININGRLHR